MNASPAMRETWGQAVAEVVVIAADWDQRGRVLCERLSELHIPVVRLSTIRDAAPVMPTVRMVVVWESARVSAMEEIRRLRGCAAHHKYQLTLVTNDSEGSPRLRYLAAYAHKVYCRDVTPNTILRSIVGTHNGLLITAEDACAAYIRPTVSATVRVLSEMAHVKAHNTSVRWRMLPSVMDGLVATVDLESEMHGRLSLCLPGATAWSIACRMLHGIAPGINAAIIEDSIGEITNVIAGQLRADLADEGMIVQASVPVVTRPVRDHISILDSPGAELCFDSDAGDLALRLQLLADEADRDEVTA